jgi:hypothetical protein
MRKLLNRKIAEQNGKCAICHKEFTEYSDIVPDHKHPKGMYLHQVNTPFDNNPTSGRS